MKKENVKKWDKSFRTRSSLAILITAALLIELTSVIQSWFTYKDIQREVKHKAENELRIKSLEIEKVLSSVETAAENMVWTMEKNLDNPDSIFGICQHILENTNESVGCGAGFVANFFPQKGIRYEPYTKRLDNGLFERRQIGSDNHDYFNMEWFKKTIEQDKGYWSEPYFDDSGAEMMLSTYTQPIHDNKGECVGVMGVDVSLDWLTDVINAGNDHVSSYNMLISKEGKMMVCPQDSLVLRADINQVTADMKDTTTIRVNREMMSGKSGYESVTDRNGEKNHVFYAPVEGETGWSMAIVCADKDIYAGLRKAAGYHLILMLIGLAILTWIVLWAVRGFKKLQEVNERKVAMENELNIANDIQMSMLPKKFPPYPERNDVDIFGQLTPAKEVGGDLFDFYIRDEKLFFCIGDVSGKGVPASLLMAVTKTQFRTVSAHDSRPEKIMDILNTAISEDNDSCMFVTLFIGVLDLPTGRLRYCNAGHDQPVLIGVKVGLLPCNSNVPVGVMPEWKFTAQETLIDAGTTIFLYTDGLTEAEDSEHNQFEKKRVMEVVEALDGTPDSMVEKMKEAVSSFVGEAEQSDDLTLMAIRYTKKHLNVKMQRSIMLTNDMENIPKLASFVEDICQSVGFDEATTMQVNLALEEAVVNVINYAYPTGTKGDINIESQANDERLKIVITDSGKPFDPTVNKKIDTSLSLEERPVGGLGIHLVRQLMDSINYERIDGKNVLTLRKSIIDRHDNE